MVDLSEFLSAANLDRNDPLALVHISYVLDNINDPAILDYAKKGVLSTPETADKLIVAQAFINEIRKEDPKSLESVLHSLAIGKPVDYLVRQSSALLAGLISDEEIAKLKIDAEKGIIAEIRKKQYDVIKQRLSPQKVYTREQFIKRMAIGGCIVLASTFFTGYLQYNHNAEVIDYAKQHQISETVQARKHKIEQMLLATKGKESVQQVAKSADLSPSVDQLLSYQLSSYETKNSTLLGKKDKDSVKYAAAEFFDMFETFYIIAADTGNVITDTDMWNILRVTHILEQADTTSFYDATMLGKLKGLATSKKDTPLGSQTLLFLAGIVNPTGKVYSKVEHGFVDWPDIVLARFQDKDKRDQLYEVIKHVPKLESESMEYYDLLSKSSKDIISKQVGTYVKLAKMTDSCLAKNSKLDTQQTLDSLLAFAQTASGNLSQYALVDAARIYHQKKLYEEGNELLQYVIDENISANGNKELLELAQKQKSVIWWNHLIDYL